MKITVIFFGALCLLTGSLLAQIIQPSNNAFSWHGELVAFDETAKTITLKSRVFGDQAASEFGRLKAGERVQLIWSGVDKYAFAIRSVQPSNAKEAEEHFAFPVEFVAYDSAQNNATFKVKVPDSAVARLKSIKPGEWVTATSPHGPSSQTQPIITIRHFNDLTSTSSN